MSRLGKRPVEIPSSVEVRVLESFIEVKGASGVLMVPSFEGIVPKISEGSCSFVCDDISNHLLRQKYGLVRRLFSNAVEGIFKGFTKTLLLQGVGYKAVLKGRELVLSLGFSHDILYKVPEGITVELLELTKIKISGIDKQKVGQVAADIREFRKPEPYKGKGVRYEGEYVRRKAGKTAK